MISPTWNLQSRWEFSSILPSLKLTFSHLKIAGWETILSIWVSAHFLVRTVSFREGIQPILVVSTHLKNMLVKLDHLPRDRGENQQFLKFHHLATHLLAKRIHAHFEGTPTNFIQDSTPCRNAPNHPFGPGVTVPVGRKINLLCWKNRMDTVCQGRSTPCIGDGRPPTFNDGILIMGI